MVIEELVARLMTEDELASSRVGIATSRPLEIDAAEVVTLDPRKTDGEVGCELVVVDAGDQTPAVLPTAVRRLTRGGIIVAVVPADLAAEAARVASTSGIEWVALLAPDSTDRRYLVAASGLHPTELGPLVSEQVVHPPSAESVAVPQNRSDRGRRRMLRREGRDRLTALAERLRARYGDTVSRVVAGIAVLTGDRRAEFNAPGSRPAIFLTPGLAAEGWPDPTRWPRLGQVMAACERYGPEVRVELLALIASRSFRAYVEDSYNADKFQMKDPNGWQSITLFDEGEPTAELPADCRSTRAMLAELAPHISGEVVLLRVAPTAALTPHHDDNDYQQTVHIGLSIPPECGIRAGGHTHVGGRQATGVLALLPARGVEPKSAAPGHPADRHLAHGPHRSRDRGAHRAPP